MIDPISTTGLTAIANIGAFAKKYWSQILIGLLTIIVCTMVYKYIQRGHDVEDLKDANDSKASVIDMTSDKQVKEEELNNDVNKRLDRLDKEVDDKQAPISPAVRSAINSLY